MHAKFKNLSSIGVVQELKTDHSVERTLQYVLQARELWRQQLLSSRVGSSLSESATSTMSICQALAPLSLANFTFLQSKRQGRNGFNEWKLHEYGTCFWIFLKFTLNLDFPVRTDIFCTKLDTFTTSFLFILLVCSLFWPIGWIVLATFCLAKRSKLKDRAFKFYNV